MSKDLSAPAARKALKYKHGTHPGGGLPAADVSADEAHNWYTAGQVAEALEVGSHEIVDEAPAPAKESAS